MSNQQVNEVLPASGSAVDAPGILSLDGKVAVVTGGSSGIGRAIALAYAAAGADVAVTYRTNRRGADETADGARAAGRRAEAIRADVAEQGDLDALAETLRRTFAHVDVWVNNAGADILTGDAARLSRTEKLDRLLAVDLRGTVLASWKAVEVMDAHPPASGGVILNMSWDHVLAGGIKSDYAQVFCAAKGGVYSFSRALAHSVAPRIRVNVLGPGWIETAYGSGLDPAVKQRIAAKIPLGRWGTPEDIAHAAVYLASDAAAYVTGQMLMINGGGVVSLREGDRHGSERTDLLRRADRGEAQGLPRLVVRGRLDPSQLQDGRLAHDADARERHRLRRRSGIPSPRPLGDVGAGDREAAESRGGGHHRQGLRARTQDR